MISPSIEDYLERIYELIEGKGYARVSDIASALNFSRPSVTAMVQRLDRLGFLRYERYRGLTLTAKGREIARRIQRRHVILTEFFTLLQIDRNLIARDVEGIEHHLSSESLERLELLLEYWKAHPAQLQLILQPPTARRKKSSTKATPPTPPTRP
ncbi:MAG: transcriptional regulator MntR [Blastochloris sp.]|nr:transcriptional regulator MntR [Blastochloris sp.]